MLYISHPEHGCVSSGRQQRRGIVLLVVIAMLTFFSVVALSFVFYAEGEASASALFSQGFNKNDPDVDPELLLSYFMGQFLYGVPNTAVSGTANYASVLRGHSLADTKFGSLNNPAYSGIGRLHYNNAALGGGDDYYFPNYQYFPADGFVRDPEYYGSRTTPAQPINLGAYRAGNAPYTYPDLNNMFLARVDMDPTTGLPVVVAPSFNRLFLNQLLQGNQTDRYRVLFPTQSYNTNYNPSEADPNTLANVRNLDNSMGFKYVAANGNVSYYNNDSYWLDLGFPWMIAPNGKKFKPLFAPLITDLDNRINMYVAGNALGGIDKNGNPLHASNRGYTANEINLAYLYSLQGYGPQGPMPAKELATWLLGRVGAVPPGSYPATWPANTALGTGFPRDGSHYARIDFDGLNLGPYQLPVIGSFLTTPTYPTWYNGNPITSPPELASPWLGFNPYSVSPLLAPFDAVLRHRGTGAPASTSNWFATMPTTFGNAALRSQLTPASWSLDHASGSPYIATGPTGGYQYNAALGYAQGPAYTSPNFNPLSANPYVPPAGEFNAAFSSQLVAVPGQATGVLYGLPVSLGRSTGPTVANNALVQRIRVNLNRISRNQNTVTGLPYDYPQPNLNGYIDLTQAANLAAFTNAQLMRQQLAWDIYNVLALVSGAWDPNTYTTVTVQNGAIITVGSTAGFPFAGTININVGGTLMPVAYTGTTAVSFTGCTGIKGAVNPGAVVTNALLTQASTQWQAARWLAQLAVNIVDYIDNDDINTPFTWFTDPNSLIPSEIIYGTEPPRLVLNEVWASLDNDPADPGLKNATPTATTYNLNVWAELHNPGRTIPSTTVAVGSNGQALPQPVIAVTSTAGLPTAGIVAISINGSLTTVAYTNIDPVANTLTGCSGGSGMLATGQIVNAEQYPQDVGMARLNVNMPSVSLLIDPMSDGKALPQGTIYVQDPGNQITSLPTAGIIAINTGMGTTTWTLVNYTGLMAAAGGVPAAFTGCSGGTGTLKGMPAGMEQTVKPYNAAYQIVLEGPDANLRTPMNATGNPAAPLNTLNFWWNPGAVPTQVEPASGAFSDPLQANHGFFVVGPSASTTYVAGRNPSLPSSYQSDQLTVKGAPFGMLASGTTVLLRRLACPYIPPQPTPGLPNYNPYITVDYLQNVPTQNNLLYNPTLNKNAPALNTLSSYGRLQPYAAAYVAAQTTTLMAGQPKSTLYQHNGAAAGPTLTMPFNWLTHLDRPLVNQLELLYVSGFRPHELTQQFMTYNANGAVIGAYQHMAPWTNQAAMIYRALDFLGVPSYLNGASALDARGYPSSNANPLVPGKVNINTLNDPLAANIVDPTAKIPVPPVFSALCDYNQVANTGGGSFTAADVTNTYVAMIASRSQGPLGTPSINDVPFRSFSAGYMAVGDQQYPNGAGLGDTLLRLNGAGTPVFQLAPVPGVRMHPYQQYALLQKIFNNVTTTSEVFAVWLTVGFFEVDDSTSPPMINAEIGYAQGRHIRHRMFAIVDRSKMLTNPGPQVKYSLRTPASPVNNSLIVPYWTIMK